MSKVLSYKPKFNKEELNAITKTFKVFADKDGILDLNKLVKTLKQLRFDEQEPVIYDLIYELQTENKNGVDYDEFVDKLTEKLQDRESQKSTERVYELFVEDPKGTVTYEVLKKVNKEVGDKDTDEDLKRYIKNGASNGNDINYDEFHSIMVKDFSLK